MHAGFTTTALSLGFNALGAWLRLAAVVTSSFNLALASSVSLGFYAGVMICTFTDLPMRYFPPHERSLVTSIAVQCNYLGQALGSLIPYLVSPCTPDASTKQCSSVFLSDTRDRFEHTLLSQAVAMTAPLPLFVILRWCSPSSGIPAAGGSGGHGCSSTATNALPAHAHASTSPRGGTSGSHGRCEVGGALSAACNVGDVGHGGEGADSALLLLLRNRQFCVHACCYSILGGVSFAIPGIQDSIFTGCLSSPSLDSSHTMWLNFAFIICGVLTGLALGCVIKADDHQALAVKALFACAVASTTAIAILSTPAVASHASEQLGDALYVMLVALMGLAGASSIGFIGLGLHIAAALAHPVSEAYSGGLVEWSVFAWGAILTQLSRCELSFWLCAGASWFVLVVLFALAAFPTKRSALSSRHLN